MDDLYLKIVTPDHVFYDGKVERVIARGMNGDFAIMKNHIPYIAALKISTLKILIDGKTRLAAIAGGYLTFKNNEIVIMSDACEWGDEIDITRAEKARLAAEKRMQEAKDSKEHQKAEISLKKAINRLGTKENLFK